MAYKLYSAEACPFAQRARLALEVVGAKYEIVEIDLQNKPSWYASKVNPASKVPVLQLGEDDNALKFPESLVIMDLVADLHAKDHSLLPEDPIQRAQSRYFAERFSQLVGTKYHHFLRGNLDSSALPELYSGVTELEGLLEAQGPGPFFLGEKLSWADVAIAPFIARLLLVAREELGGLQGTGAYETLTGSKFPRFAAYSKALLASEAFKKTWNESVLLARVKGVAQQSLVSK